ncbi:SGNH/GDSL hydrolase family protein [Paenibacillus apis]|uniref:SGNH hydrolase-type esterase domain-containing protein n=1 Tax=Paenibacillus apis TaxID=1792174 RepID=A0A919Y3D3_9BACL|nr:SGNH/GDSL hydrolase family protein [Paenibacillus apis]GIO41422.1 hypothetical protein J41TS4_11800 [Paenibacillus apis]
MRTGQQVCQHRSRLNRTGQRLREGKLTIGFIGGSITDGRPRHNWPEPVTAWMVDRFKGVRICVENAAIGATGSDLAVLRAKRDLLDRGCDLIFVEYAVNDNDLPTERRMATREGLIRKLLAGESAKGEGKQTMDEPVRDIVLVHTICQKMYEGVLSGQIPASVAELEQLADRYRLNSVWMGLHAFEEVQRGMMSWEDWLPDGLHPTLRGSYSYAQSVIAFLEQQLGNGFESAHINEGRDSIAVNSIPFAEVKHELPEPLCARHWQDVSLLPLNEVRLEGHWVTKRWLYYEWFDQVLETSTMGAKLHFQFTGRGAVLAFDFGKSSAEFRYRFDGGEWMEEQRDRPDWAGKDGWLRLSILAEDLPMGEHLCELEVIRSHDSASWGGNFRLGLIGIIR